MNKRAKITLFSILGLAVLFILLFLSVKSQSITEVAPTPSIPNNAEIKYYGYKFANYSNIIISTKAEISCAWKPDSIDDGWKICEAVFNVENLNNVKPTITVPNLNFSFLNLNIRNVIINFSNISSLYNETYFNTTRSIINITDLDGNNKTIVNTTENIIQFIRRGYSNFTAIPNSINTAIPFAIKITYEAPKYQANSFNFNISTTGFSGFIDPNQSACGTLSTANSIYTLNQSVNSTVTCFTITANNITLNGAGYTINYSSTDVGYGIYVQGANATTIKGFADIAGQNDSFPSGGAHGILIQNARNTTVINVTVTSIAIYSDGIAISSSHNNNITGNKIRHTGPSSDPVPADSPDPGALSYGISLSSSDNNTIISNDIVASGVFAAYGIYVSSSKNNTFNDNNVTSSNDAVTGAHAVSISTGNSNSFNRNVISASTASSNGIDATSSANTTFYSNRISVTGASGIGILVSGGSFNNFTLINISTTSTDSYGMQISSTNHNLFNSLNITTAKSGSFGIYFSTRSNNNSFSQLLIKSNSSNAIFLFSGDHNFTLKDSSLNSSQFADFLVNQSARNGEWNFTNVTRDNSALNITWVTGANGTLNIHWYLDAFANYTNGSVASNANISAWNVNNIFQFSQLTGANGRITRQELLEYKRNETSGTNFTYYSNYTINATLPSQNLTQSWNISTNRDLLFTFGVVGEDICGVLNETNKTYTLGTNVNSTGTCFTITANNITLDCQNYNITYDVSGGGSVYGTTSTGYNLSLIKNCNINDNSSTGSSSRGIFFKNVFNASIIDNNITAKGSSGAGIYLQDSSYNLIQNGRVSSEDTGIQIHTTSGNKADRNNVTGVIIVGSSCSGGCEGIQFTGLGSSDASTVRYINFSSADVFLKVGTIINFSADDINAGSLSFSVLSSVKGGGNWNLTNVSFGSVIWNSGSNGTLNIMRYLDAFANYTNSTNASNANISAWNVNNIFQFSNLTGTNGRIARQTLLEYKRNETSGTNITYYSNYTINATRYDGKENLTQSWNISANRDLLFTFDVTPPTAPVFSCTPSDVTQGQLIICSCSGSSDANSGIDSYSYTVNPDTELTGAFSLTCVVTDKAGNSNSSIALYTVNLAPSPGGLGGGQGGGGGEKWKKTIIVSDEQFADGNLYELKEMERLKINISGIDYYIGILKIVNNTAKIEVMSAKTIILDIDKDNKLELTSDNYYDILIRLNYIRSNKAGIYIKSLYESVTAPVPETKPEKQPSEESKTGLTGETINEKEEKVSNYLGNLKSLLNNKNITLIFVIFILTLMIGFIISLIQTIKKMARKKEVGGLEKRILD